MNISIFGLGSALLAVSLLGAAPAEARDRHVDISFSIGVPVYAGVGYYSPPPVYYYGPPVVYQPQHYRHHPKQYYRHGSQHPPHYNWHRDHGDWKRHYRGQEHYGRVEHRDPGRGGDGDRRGRR